MCQYCDMEKCESIIAGRTIDTYVYANLLISLDCETGCENEANINYCPMCGRKLEEEK